MKFSLHRKDWDLFSSGWLEVKLKQRSLCELAAGSCSITPAQFTKSGENCLSTSTAVESKLAFSHSSSQA